MRSLISMPLFVSFALLRYPKTPADAADEAAFHTALNALLDTVRRLGTPLPDEAITPSDLVLPDQDASLNDVQALLSDEGLIPG